MPVLGCIDVQYSTQCYIFICFDFRLIFPVGLGRVSTRIRLRSGLRLVVIVRVFFMVQNYTRTHIDRRMRTSLYNVHVPNQASIKLSRSV